MVVASISKPLDLPRLSPRQSETLQRLMLGESEKEAAVALGISPGTLHCYVKEIYRAFAVNSRCELLIACFGILSQQEGKLPTSRKLAEPSRRLEVTVSASSTS
jgi:DNA-binding CsgD family transcriptional regulator